MAQTQAGLFIRGGWTPFHKRERNRIGLPSRFGVGPFYFRFPIAEKHTAYEWVMALADQHPYAYPIASLFSSGWADLQAETIAGMRARERAIDYNEQAAGIYRDLKAEVDARRLHPLRTERCVARPGIDPRNVPDFTRYVFSIDQVLPLIRRRRDKGWLVGKLIADAGEPQDVAKPLAVASHTSGTRTTTDEKVEVACREWIAALTERPRDKETAFAKAKAAVVHIGALSHKAFDRAWANRAPGDWKEPGRRKKRPLD